MSPVIQSIRSKAMTQMLTLKTNTVGTSLGGPVVKNPPVNAGDTGLIPDPGRFHVPWSNYTHRPQLLSQHALGPTMDNKRGRNNEKPATRG